MSECVRTQLEEVELLQATFPGPSEFYVDEGWMEAARAYLEDREEAPPPLRCVVRPPGTAPLELTLQLPREYPTVAPEAFVRSPNLDRVTQKRLNDQLQLYVTSLPRGDSCIYTLVSWLQDNAEEYCQSVTESVVKKLDVPKTYSRLWIYSHHIYSKTKRKDILSLAGEFNLTGFMLAGKPGIVCVEGEKDDCEKWWARIKAMNWKKIVVKKTEDYLDAKNSFVRKFPTFEEISFQNTGNRNSDHHMDMGELYKYLTDHDCSYVFVDYFGISGRPSS